jgi:hypothetical protein
MLGLEQVRRYGWADEDINLAWTLAVITGRTVGETVRAYGGDPGRDPRMLTFAQAQVPPDALGRRAYLQVREVGQHTVAIENNGWLGKRADIAERASRDGGGFLSVFWNLNADYKLTQAVDGKLTAQFDPLTVQHLAPVGDTYPDWIADVVFTDESLHAVLLALVEQQTGLVFDPVWLTEPQRTYYLPT